MPERPEIAPCPAPPPAGDQVEIQLGHLCNNRCVFCVSGQNTELGLAGPVPAEPVFAALEEAAARGARKVTFLGGEPTIQKSFLPSLRRAAELGFDDIVIFTNGVRTPAPTFIDEVLRIAPVTWRFSIQGGNEAAHDDATEKKGSFAKILRGLTLLQERGQPVTANTCINERSYRSLPDYPALVFRYGIRQLHIDMVRPADAGVRTDEYLRGIMPRYSEMAPYFRAMLEGFERVDPDFDVNVGNFPYCLLPEWAHKVHHDGETTFTVSAEGDNRLSAAWDKYAHQRAGGVYAPECAECLFRPECRGLPAKYAQFYGTEELQPLTAERLQVHDPSGRHFVRALEKMLQPLLAAEPPHPWRRETVNRNPAGRSIAVSFAGGAARVAVTFGPPGAPFADALVTADRCTVGITGRGASPGEAVALARWIEARLREGGAQVTTPLDSVRAAAGTIDAARLDRGRAWLARLAARLDATPLPAPWRLAAGRSLEHGLGILRTVEHAEGGGFEVLLEVQGDPSRPPVGADFELRPGTDAESARPAVEAVLAALRG
jgi:MoaA/NifB/PqqE/SkfB family radical SAM enzyme